MNPAVAEVIARGNPVVFFDISIGGVAAGRIACELFADIVPKTAGMYCSSTLMFSKAYMPYLLCSLLLLFSRELSSVLHW